MDFGVSPLLLTSQLLQTTTNDWDSKERRQINLISSWIDSNPKQPQIFKSFFSLDLSNPKSHHKSIKLVTNLLKDHLSILHSAVLASSILLSLPRAWWSFNPDDLAWSLALLHLWNSRVHHSIDDPNSETCRKWTCKTANTQWSRDRSVSKADSCLSTWMQSLQLRCDRSDPLSPSPAF